MLSDRVNTYSLNSFSIHTSVSQQLQSTVVFLGFTLCSSFRLKRLNMPSWWSNNKIKRGHSLGPTTFTVVFGGDMGEGLLCYCFQQEARLAPSLLSFHKQANTFLFRQVFPQWLAAWVGFVNGLLCLTAFNVFLVLLLFTIFSRVF